MKYVEILKLQNDGSQKVFAVCKLEGERVTFGGDENFFSFAEKEGIRNYSDSGEKQLFPKDGILFLEQLKNNFKSGYLNASEILEK